jgi:hypothetical protein
MKTAKQTEETQTEQIERDLAFLECCRYMRKEFTDRICDASALRTDKVLAILRLEATYQLAEFYYLLAARELRTAEQIEALTDLHNDYIAGLTRDKNKMERMGLANERLLDAMFTVDTLPRLLQNWREKPGAIDQSNLARFLATVMSTETCRKVVVACGQAGFLGRERTPYGTMLISSCGVLERTLSDCIRSARARLSPDGGTDAD